MREPKPSDEIRQASARLDAGIAPLVRALRAGGFDTLASCSGHNKGAAYVDLAVRGLDGLRSFVAATVRAQRGARTVFIDVSLNWDPQAVTACDFRWYPDWIMLSVRIGDDADPPSARALAKIARLYAQKPRRTLRRRKR